MAKSRPLLSAAIGLSVFAAYFAGCAPTTASRELKPVPNPPNLVGKWKGELQERRPHAIQMVVQKQQGAKLGGVVSSPDWGEDHRFDGSVGASKDGSLWVVVEWSGHRAHELVMKVVSDRRLEGVDEAGHGGTIYLNRE